MKKLVVRYLDPEMIEPFHVETICRRQPNQPNQPDLTPEAQDFYKAIEPAAKHRWE